MLESQKFEGFSFINKQGGIIHQLSGDYIQEYIDNIAIILRDGEWGLVNLDGTILIQFGTYFYIQGFNQGYSVVSEGEEEDNLLDGLIDLSGKIIIECKYKLKDYGDGLIPFQNENTQLWGFMDLNSTVVISEEFEDVKSFSDGMAPVCKNEKWGAINTSGELVIEHKYDGFNSFSTGMACVNQGGQAFYINKKGVRRTKSTFDIGYSVNKGTAIVVKNEKYGMIDLFGQEILPCVYEDLQPYSEGFIPIMENDLWGFVNVNGQKVIDCQYESVGSFSEGLAKVKLDDRWVFIDYTGNTKLDLSLSEAEGFENGLAQVVIDQELQNIDHLIEGFTEDELDLAFAQHNAHEEGFELNNKNNVSEELKNSFPIFNKSKVELLSKYDPEIVVYIKVTLDSGAIETGYGSGKYEGYSFELKYTTQWIDGYLEANTNENITISDILDVLKKKPLSLIDNTDFDLRLGQLKNGYPDIEINWTNGEPDEVPDDEDLYKLIDIEDSNYEWSNAECIEFEFSINTSAINVSISEDESDDESEEEEEEEEDDDDEYDDEEGEKGFAILDVINPYKIPQESISNYLKRWQNPSITYNDAIGIDCPIPDFVDGLYNDNFYPKFSSDEIAKIRDLIYDNKIIPILRYNEPESLTSWKKIWWIIPYCIWKQGMASMVFVDKNGFYGIQHNNGKIGLEEIADWGSIKSVDYEYGLDDDINLARLTLNYHSGGYVTFDEFIADDWETGSYLAVIEYLWAVREDTILASKDHTTWFEGVGGEGFVEFSEAKDLLEDIKWSNPSRPDPKTYGYEPN